MNNEAKEKSPFLEQAGPKPELEEDRLLLAWADRLYEPWPDSYEKALRHFSQRAP